MKNLKKPDRLTEAKVCEIVGISQSDRHAQVRRGLLPAAEGKGLGIQDASELAAFQLIRSSMAPSELAVAWPQVRAGIREKIASDRLDFVFDTALGKADLALTHEALASLVATGRPTVVVPLAARIVEVREAYRRWAATAAPPKEAARPRALRRPS
jgi:hypothetical protein